MSTSPVNWDELYRPSAPERFRQPAGLMGVLRDGSNWLNLLLLFIALLAMTTSLTDANWVDEMPSLTFAMLLGLVSGWVLAHLPIRQWPLQVLGVAIGLTGVFVLVLERMELADPLLGSGPRQRWDELWLRLQDWFGALIEGGVSNDPLPFVLALVCSVWVVSYVSAWAVVRWRNVWAALIPPGFVLLTNISYLPRQSNLHLVVFLFASVLLVLQLHYAKALDRWRREHVSWPDMMSLEVVFAGVWIALGLILSAWIVPTANNWGPVADVWYRVTQPVSDRFEGLSRVFIGVSSGRDIPVHNFGEVLPLQGQVKLNDEPLMEVVTEEIGNLRGAVYDEYTGSGWRISSAQTRPQFGTTVEAAEFGTPITTAQLRVPITVEITVLGPVPDRRLLAPGDAIASDVESDLILGASEIDIIGVVPGDRLEEGVTYTIVGAISGASASTMLSTPTEYPASIRERYTTLPSDLPPEVGELTRSLVPPGTHPYQAARIIEQYLRDTYPYTLEVADPPPLSDGVSYFLFDARAGYFDHHASAMAVMLRTIGIPTRIAAGFAIDEEDLDPTTKTYLLTEEDAWAWPEVYLSGLGWVEFNPTPGRPLVARAGEESERRLLLTTGASASNFPSEEDLLQDLDFVGGGDSIPLALGGDGLETGSGVGALVVRVLTVAIAGAVALLVVLLGTRFAWEYSFREVPAPMRHWAKLQRLTAWAGLRPAVTNTPLEWAREVARRIDDDGELELLARSYTSARYGNPDHAPTEEQLERQTQSYRQVRTRLWRRILARPLPRRRRDLAVGDAA